MAAPRWASFERSCDQYGRKLRADHGGSTPGGVLERAVRTARDAAHMSRECVPDAEITSPVNEAC